ncbi:MAG: NAD-dependent epimerase/dehydratase family protein [bacterium]
MINAARSRGSFLVTGADGFIGARSVRLLVADGYRVRATDLPARPRRLCDVRDYIEYVPCDISHGKKLESLVEDVDYVLHFAARGVIRRHGDTIDDLVKTNLLAAYYLIHAAGNRGVKKVVCAGSVFEYGYRQPWGHRENLGIDTAVSPINVYGVTKAAASLLVPHAGDEAGIETCVLRIFSPYGPGEPDSRFVSSLIRAALQGEEFKMTKGEQIRDFCYVDDVVHAFIETAQIPAGEHRAFNLGTGRGLSLSDAARIILSVSGRDIPILTGAIPYRPNEAYRLVADPCTMEPYLRDCLKTSFEEGIRKTVDWMKTHEESRI